MKASLVCAALEPRDGGRAYWFDQMPMAGCSGTAAGNSWVGNVFCQQQAELDAIIADPRTEFSFPIDVIGTELAYSDAIEIPPAARGRIIAWCASTYGAEFGQAVAANAKNRRFVAEMILRKASGVPDADPLNGFRIGW